MSQLLASRFLGVFGVGFTASTARRSNDNFAKQERISGDSNPGELLGATVFFRHGARTPVFTDIPGLSNISWGVTTDAANASLPPVNIFGADGGPRPPLSRGVQAQRNFILPGGAYAGQLTDLGIEQTKDLGRVLRSRYDRFLGDDPNSVGMGPNARITVRTTNVPRCVASAQGVLFGLFEHSQVRRQDPFPLQTMPTKIEYATPNTKACARLAELWDDARKAWRERPDGDGPKVLSELEHLLAPAAFEAFHLKSSNFIPVRDLVVALDAHGMPALRLLKDPTAAAVPGSSSSARDGGSGNHSGSGGSSGASAASSSTASAVDSKNKEGAGAATGVESASSGDVRDELVKRLDRLGGLQVQSLLQGGGGWANERETCRLGIGRLLKETLETFDTFAAKAAAAVAATHEAPEDKSSSTSGRSGSAGAASLHLVSAHDTTLVPLLSALSNNDGSWPNYASYIAFELWKLPQQTRPEARGVPTSAVRVVYNGKVLAIPGCSGVGEEGPSAEGLCSLDDFRRALDGVLPQDLEVECRPKKRSVLRSGDGDKF